MTSFSLQIIKRSVTKEQLNPIFTAGFFCEKGGPKECCGGEILLLRCVKRTDNFSAQQQKNSDKREIKCQNHLSTLHPLFKKDFLVAELMGKVGRRKSYVFKRISWTLPSILKLVGTPGTSKSIGENCQCANSKKRRHLLTKTRRQRKSRKTASKVRLCKSLLENSFINKWRG